MFGSLNMIQTIDMHYPIFRSFSVLIIKSCGQQHRKPRKKSRKTTALILPRSILYAQVSVASSSAVTVE